VKLLKRMLIESGGGSALTSESCKHDHMEFFRRGYSFCPHCGKRIEVLKVCPSCGRSFASGKAFRYHAIAFHAKPDKCPACGSKTNLRREVARATAAGATKEANIWHCRKCDARFKWFKSSLKTKIISSPRSDLAGLVHFLNPRVT
jgi:hypothetical protein